jgi:hypothetical protein
MMVGISAAGGCAIATLLASNRVALPASLVWGGVFATFFSTLASRRPFLRVVGCTATGGCSFAAGLAANGSATVLQAVAAGAFLWLSLLGILSLAVFTRWPARALAGGDQPPAAGNQLPAGGNLGQRVN